MKPALHWVVLMTLFFLSSGLLLAQVEVFKDPTTGKKGLLHSTDGHWVLPVRYDDVQKVYPNDSLWIVRKGALKGLFTEGGRAIIPIQYDEIEATFQMGTQLGFCGARKGKLVSLYRLDGKQLLPLRYEYLQVLATDLFVARLPGSVLLTFYDEKGKELFQYTGESAWPGFNEQTIEVIRADKSRVFIDRKGQPVFPERWKDARWTDGKRVVVGRVVNNAKIEEMGLLTWAGDTLLACQYSAIIPSGPDRFLVLKDGRLQGMVNEQGAWLIPLEKGVLELLGDRPGNYWLRRSPKTVQESCLYDQNGTLFAANCRLGSACFLLKNDPEFVFLSNLYTYTFLGKDSSGLIEGNGKQILPARYSNIRIKSSKHSILAQRGASTFLHNWNGQLLTEQAFSELVFTEDPYLFLARRAEDESLGFFYLDHPEESRFNLERIIDVRPKHYFGVKEDGAYFLYSPSGKKISNQPCVFIGPPGPGHFKAWLTSRKKGELVAYGQLKEKAWIAFDANGKGYKMPPLTATEEKQPPLLDLEVGHGKGSGQ